MAKRRKSRKGKMPAGLKAYWAKKRRGGKKRSTVKRASSPRRTRRRSTKKAKHRSESRNASAEAQAILRAASDKIRKLSWGFSGRAGRRK